MPRSGWGDPSIRVLEHSTLRDALIALRRSLGSDRIAGILYGFIAQRRSRARNDFIIAHTGPPSWDDGFSAQGGTATDIVAARVEHTTEPYALDLEPVEARMGEKGDARLGYIRMVRQLGIETVWVTPICHPNLAGYGVLNFLMREAKAQPPMPPEDLLTFASQFHTAAQRGRLLAREVGLTAKERDVLVHLSLGNTAADIALAENVTDRAIELRLQSARKKLHAANSTEAIHKATIYGILPS